MTHIFIAYAISAGKRTDEEKKTMFEIAKIRHHNPEMSYESFSRLQKSWRDFDYYADADPQGYYATKEEAEFAVTHNCADINECGAYPYAAVACMPMGCMYASSYMTEEDVSIYKYNRGTDSYIPVVAGESKLYRRIMQEVLCQVRFSNNDEEENDED